MTLAMDYQKHHELSRCLTLVMLTMDCLERQWTIKRFQGQGVSELGGGGALGV